MYGRTTALRLSNIEEKQRRKQVPLFHLYFYQDGAGLQNHAPALRPHGALKRNAQKGNFQ